MFQFARRLLTGIVLCGGLATAAQADVYRVVDEAGRVSYTDRPPDAEATPLELAPLNATGPVPASPSRPENNPPSEPPTEEVPGIRALRASYRDFRIVHPVEGQTFRGASNPATVAWNTGQPLEPGMKVVFSIDGQRRPATREPVISTGQLDRGEHTVSAVLLDRANRRVATADEVSFHIHREVHWLNLPAIGIRKR